MACYVQSQRELLGGALLSREAEGESRPARHVQVDMPSPYVLCVQVDARERRTLLTPPTIQSRAAACREAQQAAQGLLSAYQALRAKQAGPAPAASRPVPPDPHEVREELASLRARRAEVIERRDRLDEQIDGDDARHVYAARRLTAEHPRLGQIVQAIDVLQAKRDDPWLNGSTRRQAAGELADRYVELKAELVRLVAQWERQGQELAGPIALLEAAACGSQAASQPSSAFAAASTAPADRPERLAVEVVVLEGPSLPDWMHPHRPLLAAHVATAAGGGLLAGLAFLRVGRRGKSCASGC